jgi:hypothetical protein
VSFVSFTVPQYQRQDSYFAPLARLTTADPATELNFALVPYHPAEQAPGTTGDQVRLIDAALAGQPGRPPWLGHLHRMRDGPRQPGPGSRAARPAPPDHRRPIAIRPLRSPHCLTGAPRSCR